MPRWGGVRYRRITKSDATYSGYWSGDGYGLASYRYFRYDPIKWRVLEVSGSTAFVLADVALDDQPYNTNLVDVTWESCSVRSWLNGYGADSNQPGTDYGTRSFLATAFSSAGMDAIRTSTVVNAVNEYLYASGGNDTSDKVFLLSSAEFSDAAFGFTTSSYTLDEARRCKTSDYAHAMGAGRYNKGSEYDGNCLWWLRSPGIDPDAGIMCDVRGHYDVYRDGDYAVTCHGAIRPALNLDLSSAFVRTAGTVSSDGIVNEGAPGDTPVDNPFVDVTSATAHKEEIVWLAQQKISEGWTCWDDWYGCEWREFRPYATVARADMAAFLFRLARLWGVVDDGWQPTGASTFADVTEKTAHYREVMWLVESGISQGWTLKGGRREFRPYATVARADMAAFLARLARLARRGTAIEGTKGAFSDVTVATAHAEDIAWLAASGVSRGWDMPDGTRQFRPLAKVARADMAAFLQRLDALG